MFRKTVKQEIVYLFLRQRNNNWRISYNLNRKNFNSQINKRFEPVLYKLWYRSILVIELFSRNEPSESFRENELRELSHAGSINFYYENALKQQHYFFQH